MKELYERSKLSKGVLGKVVDGKVRFASANALSPTLPTCRNLQGGGNYNMQALELLTPKVLLSLFEFSPTNNFVGHFLYLYF